LTPSVPESLVELLSKAGAAMVVGVLLLVVGEGLTVAIVVVGKPLVELLAVELPPAVPVVGEK
jgi:hypothetical protein